MAARDRLSTFKTSAEQVEAMCTAAAALGIVSLRAPILALRVACASAALSAHDAVDQDDIALAARLVLAPRALVFPQEEPEQSQQPQEQPPPESAEEDKADTGNPEIDRALDEVILAAVQAATPGRRACGVADAVDAIARRARKARPAHCRNPTNAAGRPARCAAICAPAPGST